MMMSNTLQVTPPLNTVYLAIKHKTTALPIFLYLLNKI